MSTKSIITIEVSGGSFTDITEMKDRDGNLKKRYEGSIGKMFLDIVGYIDRKEKVPVTYTIKKDSLEDNGEYIDLEEIGPYVLFDGEKATDTTTEELLILSIKYGQEDVDVLKKMFNGIENGKGNSTETNIDLDDIEIK